jgi:hypothetical protein
MPFIITQQERDALGEVLDRAWHDAEDYLLGPHAKLDYLDEYAGALRSNAKTFRVLHGLLRKLAMPRDQWEELAHRLEVTAYNEETTSHKKVLYGLCKVCGHYGDDCTGKE